MRIQIIIAIALLLQLSSLAQDSGTNFKPRELPESPQRPGILLKTNPFTILWGTIPFTAEYRLVAEMVTSSDQSVQISASYLGKSPIVSILEEDSAWGVGKLIVKGYRFQLSYKYYLSGLTGTSNPNRKYAPEGIYVAPHISYATAILTNKPLQQYNIYIRGSHLNVVLLGGYQIFLGEHVAIDFFSGVGYKKNVWLERYANRVQTINMDEFPAFYNSPVKVMLGFNLGIAIN